MWMVLCTLDYHAEPCNDGMEYIKSSHLIHSVGCCCSTSFSQTKCQTTKQTSIKSTEREGIVSYIRILWKRIVKFATLLNSNAFYHIRANVWALYLSQLLLLLYYRAGLACTWTHIPNAIKRSRKKNHHKYAKAIQNPIRASIASFVFEFKAKEIDSKKVQIKNA